MYNNGGRVSPEYLAYIKPEYALKDKESFVDV